MKTIDFITTVIDNYWDAGFAFNLAISLLKKEPNLHVRFFLDDEKLFLKLKWDIKIKNLTYYDLKEIKNLKPSHIVFNFFDRKIDFEYLHNFEYEIKLINFSYFLMHSGVKSLHNTSYTSKNVSVTHYIPSLLPEWWWVIINPYWEEFEKDVMEKWVLHYKKELIPNLEESLYQRNWISVFCYKETFENIKNIISQDNDNFYLIFDNTLTWKNVINMPFLNILEYGKILYLCEKNIVRWENSLVWALMTKNPFLWDIYKEHNGAHKEKIEDFWNFLISKSNTFSDYLEIFRGFNSEENIKKWFEDFLLYKAKNQVKLLDNETNLLKNIKKYL